MRVCVIAVPRPDPATPMPSGYMSTQFATALNAAPADAAIRGVRVSCNPRRVPVAARTTNMPTSPGAEARRYPRACGSVASFAPSQVSRGEAKTARRIAARRPRPPASHMASTPERTARSRRRAPR